MAAAPDPTIPFVRGTTTARILHSGSVSSLVSDRGVPGTQPTIASLVRTTYASVNGRRVITPQLAQVTYLPDTEKLVIPSGLYRTEYAVADEAPCVRAYKTMLRRADPTLFAEADAYADANTTADDADYRGPPIDWARWFATRRGRDVLRIDAEKRTGTFSDDGVFTVRADLTSAAFDTLTWKWGADDDDEFVAAVYLPAGTAGAANAAELASNVDIQDQLSDFVSAMFNLNYSIRDHSFLNDANNRWPDAECGTPHDADKYRVRLSAYTLSMVAALNIGSVGGNARLGWTRAYALAMGLLPPGTSVHNMEYQITVHLPDNAELGAAVADHPVGPEGQMYLRGCASIIAAFGALHLANDHTYRQTDDNLLRKARVMVEACRTCLREGEDAQLSSAALLRHTVRTTVHPFGLSSTWRLFLDGQRLKLIAEPLQIRDGVVPPPVAKVGMIVDLLSKIFNLPVGKLFRDTYGAQATQLGNLRTTVVANAASYSGLHTHYGVAAQTKLSIEEEKQCESLLPVLAGYAQVFEIDELGNDHGAMLSQTLQKVIKNYGALVRMYASAFEAYAESSKDLRALVGGGTGGTSASTTSTTTSAP